VSFEHRFKYRFVGYQGNITGLCDKHIGRYLVMRGCKGESEKEGRRKPRVPGPLAQTSRAALA